MLQLKEPTGRFGRWGQIGDFWLSLIALNFLVVMLLLGEVLNASDGVRITVFSIGFLAFFYGHFLRWVPSRRRGVPVPGDHTGDSDANVEWQTPDLDTTR